MPSVTGSVRAPVGMLGGRIHDLSGLIPLQCDV